MAPFDEIPSTVEAICVEGCVLVHRFHNGFSANGVCLRSDRNIKVSSSFSRLSVRPETAANANATFGDSNCYLHEVIEKVSIVNFTSFLLSFAWQQTIHLVLKMFWCLFDHWCCEQELIDPKCTLDGINTHSDGIIDEPKQRYQTWKYRLQFRTEWTDCIPVKHLDQLSATHIVQ